MRSLGFELSFHSFYSNFVKIHFFKCLCQGHLSPRLESDACAMETFTVVLAVVVVLTERCGRIGSEDIGIRKQFFVMKDQGKYNLLQVLIILPV